MRLRTGRRATRAKKSIFRSLFIPLFLIMLLQAAIFYIAAVYGGVEESLSQNAADILSGRLHNRKNEIEAQLNNRSFDLDACEQFVRETYDEYTAAHGARPLTNDRQLQIQFLRDCSDTLIHTLRRNEANGVFLILNDQPDKRAFPQNGAEQKYGLCIRDIDQESVYSEREDLLLERAPSSIVDFLDCSLDSWWEARYTFQSEAEGDYYYNPLNAAWEHPGADGVDLAYLSGEHRISGLDHAVISYSIPLLSDDGYPFGVVGVELTTRYLASLMPSEVLGDQSRSCYALAMQEAGTSVCTPIVGAGELYARNFGSSDVISCANTAATGGFTVTGRGGVELYGDSVQVHVYNNNNPFESRRLILLSMVESRALFAYVDRVKQTLLLASLICLALGVAGISLVSRRFAAPITALAGRVRDMQPQAGFSLDRLGIAEIDQLVNAIEELNRNVSRNSARTEFFSRMSHDMRTPMNAIISFSSPELLEGASEATKDDFLKKIHASGDYLLGLINEVLDMTKIESNKTDLRLAPVRASRLCNTVVPVIEKLAQKKGVVFSRDISIDDQVFVMADAQHLDQIVMNLLSNAVKFTPPGGAVQLHVDLTDDATDESLTHCRIVVTDTGVGMSEAFMKNLYVPFEQESSTQEGTGLGLSITKKLVDLMGGTIACVSKKHIGTTFTIDLPLAKTQVVPAEAHMPMPTPSALPALCGKHVLICEDNALNMQIVSRLLEKMGISADVAKNGRVGVDAFAASDVNAYDAILMDVRMPVMDGLAAARAIRLLPRPDAATVPIIAMTANAFDEDVQASMDAGMNEHLAKPIDIKAFIAVLQRFLGGDAPEGAQPPFPPSEKV